MTAQELEKLLAEVTPGPWTPHRDPCHFDTLSDVRGGARREANGISSQIMVSVGGFAGWKEQEANTRLIALAPTLAHCVIAAEKLAEALRVIAAYDDNLANQNLRATGSYGEFDEPHSVDRAREALAEWEAAQ